MGRYLLYDCEIVRAIPEMHEPRISGFEYCDGWEDHANMGISVIGFCQILTGEDSPEDLLNVAEIFSTTAITAAPPEYLIGDKYGLSVFGDLIKNSTGVIGFNSRNFDDKLLAAHNLEIATAYDLLEEVRLAAFGSTSWRDTPRGRTYKLSAIAAANGLEKTGDGGNAAYQWQSGHHHEVINYCRNDVAITAAILRLGLRGQLKDPNTGALLQLREMP